MNKLRTSLVYLNAKRYGLAEAEARQCAARWGRHIDTLFDQAAADKVAQECGLRTVGFPDVPTPGTLYVTAHFSAYTLVSIALSRHYNRTIYIVVGTPPAEFEQTIVDSVTRAGARAVIIRSNFSMLKNIRNAIDEGSLVVSLIDVPWHRLIIPTRDYSRFDFGAGQIGASKSIFSMAERLGLKTCFVLCEPGDGQFRIVHYGEMSQARCFETLAEAVARHPDHFERFCELHAYYDGGRRTDDIVTFTVGENRYCVRAWDYKSWKLSKSVSAAIETALGADETEATGLIRSELQRLTDCAHEQIVYF